MSDPVEFIVTLAPGQPAGALADTLAAHGFKSTSVLDELSMIVGVADPEAVAGISALPGVTAIEPSQTITIPPVGPQ